MKLKGRVEEILHALGLELTPVADRAPLLRLGGHVFDPAAGALARAQGEQAGGAGSGTARTSSRPPTSAASPISPTARSGPCATGSSCSTRGCWAASAPRRRRRADRSGVTMPDTHDARRTARRLPALSRDPDALDGQRQLRPRQQRHLLLVLRHGGERAPDPRRRARHRERPGRRLRRRDELPVHEAADLSRDDRRRTARRASSERRRSTYEIGIFRQGDDEPAATGRFVHVWVDRATQRPVPIPPRIRARSSRWSSRRRR